MRRLVTILLLILCAAAPVRAATIEERIAAELQAQGYEILETNRTWLGRLRIVAENDDIRREIVFNPGTGEILRDYSVMLTLLEQRDRGLARGSKPARAPHVPLTSGPVVQGPAVPGGAAVAVAGSADPVQTPASDDPGPDDPGPDAAVDAAVAEASPDRDPATLVPLLPDPLLSSEPQIGGE